MTVPSGSATTLHRLLDRLTAERHTTAVAVVLHLLPGVLFTVAALAAAPAATDRGLPAVFGLHAAIVTVLVPVQLGLIALAARRTTGSWRLSGALRYTRRLPRHQLVALGFVTLTWAGLMFGLAGPAAETIRTTLFDWWPTGLDYTGHLDTPAAHPQNMLIAAWVSTLLATTLLAPIVEELYFRGFLLPRLEHLGRWAPIVNTVLFAVYHLWSPWQAPTRVVATLPLYYATWRTRAIVLAIVVHVALNLIGDTLATMPIVFNLR